jgi:predicted Fe-S protein YdhL (DUF1289 family)
VCVLDEQGLCRGCYRTIHEIAAWTRFSGAEQLALIVKLGERARMRGRDPSIEQTGGL